MATYYVDRTNGLNTNSGTDADHAWQTIAKVNASAFSAGDSVLFKRGETWAEQLLIPSSGSSGNPITFGWYGTTGAPPRITGGTRAIHTNGKHYLRFVGLTCDGKEFLVLNSTEVTADYCIVQRCANTYYGFTVSSSPGTVLTNCIAAGNASAGVLGYGATTTLTVTNCLIVANGTAASYGIQALMGASVTYDHCLITGNGTPANNLSSGLTDGGNNLVGPSPLTIAGIVNAAYFTVSFDDADVDYWQDVADVLEAYSGHLTAFIIPTALEDRTTDLAALAADGHEIAVHGWSSAGQTQTNAFAVTSTNTNPTVDVDRTGEQIVLWCDEVGNRVTLSWASGETIADLKTAVVGKGWTITNSHARVLDGVVLDSLADSSGAQSAPYTATLDVSAGNNYPFWRHEIVDTADWIETVTGVAPTTMSWPFGDTSSPLKAYVQGVVALAGARGVSVVERQSVSAIDVYGVGVLGLTATTLKGDGSEAEIRFRTRHYAEQARQLGGAFHYFCHSSSDLTATQHGYIFDEVAAMGGTFQTFGAVIAAIKADHSTSDNLIYTKTYADVADWHLVAGSPCIDAGVDAGFSVDIEGATVPQGTTPDIGAYEYTSGAPPEGSGTAALTLGASGAGASLRTGVGVVALTLAVAGIGQATHVGTGTTGLTLGVTGTGQATHAGTGTASLTLGATGVGAHVAYGSGVATLTLGVVGVGDAPSLGVPEGSGVATLTLAVSGAGARDAYGRGTAPLTLTATGAGLTTREGAGTATLTLTAVGVGSITQSGAGTATLTLTVTGVGVAGLVDVVVADAAHTWVVARRRDTWTVPARRDTWRIT